MNDCFLNLLFSFQLLLPLKEGADFVGSKQTIDVILEYNLYPFIIRTLGGLSDFEVTNCQPFLLLHSALICFLGISLCHKGNTFLSNMCCVL